MLCDDTGKEKEQPAGNMPRVFPFFFFQYISAFRCLGKTICGFGSFSHWSMFWPHWLSAPRSTTWAASRWVSVTTKLFCGCFLIESLQITCVALGRTVRPILWPALAFGIIFSWPLKFSCFCFPDNGNQQDPFAVSWAMLQKGVLDGEGREGLVGAWLMCSAYKCVSPSSSAPVCLRWPWLR